MYKTLPLLLVAVTAMPALAVDLLDNPGLRVVGDIHDDGVLPAYVCYDNTNMIPGCNYYTSINGRTDPNYPANVYILQTGYVDPVKFPGEDNITGITFSGCSMDYDFTNPVFPTNSDLSTLICFWQDSGSCGAGSLIGVNMLIDQLQPTGCATYHLDLASSHYHSPFTLHGTFGVSQTFLHDLCGGCYYFPPAGSNVGPILASPRFLHPLNAPPHGLDTRMVYNGQEGSFMKLMPREEGNPMPNPDNCYGGDVNCPCPGWWYGGYGVDPNGVATAPYGGFYLGLSPEPGTLLLMFAGVGLVATRHRSRPR